jgi:PTH1 family peptidyl-tRNA hydrolase
LLAVLGLGNPGDRYSDTRHNIGKNTVTGLAERLRLALKPGRGEFVFARDPSGELILAFNTTYINLSGISAADLVGHFGFHPDELLVVCDDFNLPFGTIRIRRRGGDGGHNGLGSIIASLGTEDFPRLRIGVGPLPEGMEAADFVLSPFRGPETRSLAEITGAAGQAVLTISREGLDRAMNEYNRKVAE